MVVRLMGVRRGPLEVSLSFSPRILISPVTAPSVLISPPSQVTLFIFLRFQHFFEKAEKRRSILSCKIQ